MDALTTPTLPVVADIVDTLPEEAYVSQYAKAMVDQIALGHHQFGIKQMSKQTKEMIIRLMNAGELGQAYELISQATAGHQARHAENMALHTAETRKCDMRLRLREKLRAKKGVA